MNLFGLLIVTNRKTEKPLPSCHRLRVSTATVGVMSEFIYIFNIHYA